MSIFGWSYPPGCSGPPDDPPEKPCGTCQCSESDHDVDESTGELGRCLNESCECKKFTEPPPEPDVEGDALEEQMREEALAAEYYPAFDYDDPDGILRRDRDAGLAARESARAEER